MKKLILLPLLIAATNASANELHNFNEVKSVAIAGKAIHIVVDFAKCSTSTDNTAQSLSIGVFTPTEMEILDNHIATSFNHFTVDNLSFPHTAVYEFVRYTLTNNNNLNVSAQVLDAKNFSPLTDVVSFNCKLAVGVKIYD